MKKSIAMLLSLVLALTLLAACGKTEPGPDVSDVTTDANGEAVVTEGGDTATEATTVTTEDAAATTAEEPTSEVTTAGESKAPETTEEILAFYAAAVDKALAANKQVSKHCKTVIARPLQGDDAIKKLLKIDIAGFGVEKTVCGFLGEGESTWNQSMKEALQPSTLRMDDVTGATATANEDGSVSFVINVKNCTNPKKLAEGGSPMGRFTWDFTSIQSVNDEIAGAEAEIPGLKINIAKKTLNYSNIKITATVGADGNFTKLVHSYNYTARVEDVEVKFIVKVGSGEYGQGNATGTMTFKF